jgi:CubicO group peptidase (beta-lactamase class C family)
MKTIEDMIANFKKRICMLCVIGFVLMGCANGKPVGGTSVLTPTLAPVESPPTVVWQSSSPEAQGMDSNLLVELLKTIENEAIDIHGLVVVRNGSVVLDATVFPFSIYPDSRHDVYSCTKSVISILIGIAIDEGYIEGVSEPVLNFFPEQSVANLDERKASMTVEHLLMMATGYNCRDSYLYGWDDLHRMRSSANWIQFVLDLPMIENPGSRFEYCNGASMVLSAILQEATGMSAFEFATEHLFSPLGISDVKWFSNPQGISIGYSELELRPEDMAKIGHLYVSDGLWNNEQIVSSSWVRASTRKYINATLQEGYGYHWWVDDSGIYMALGYGGQYIIVVPEEDLVVVFVSDLAERDFYLPEQLFYDYILPSIKSSDPLPEDPRATTLLRLYRHALQDR